MRNIRFIIDGNRFLIGFNLSDVAQCPQYQLQCLTGGCYLPEERCDGEYTCPDRSDEAGCKLFFCIQQQHKLELKMQSNS